MSGIKRKQLIEDEAIEAPLDLAKNFGVAKRDAEKLIKTLAKIIEIGKGLDSALDIAKKTLDVSKEVDKLTKSQTELEKIDSKISIAQEKQSKDLIEKQKQLNKINKETRQLLKEEEKLIGVEEKLIKRNKDLKESRLKLSKEDSNYEQQLKDINSEIKRNNNELKANANITNDVVEEVKKLTVEEKELEKLEKKLAIARSKQSAQFIEKEKQLNLIKKETKRLVNEENRLLGTEEKLIKRNKELKESRSRLREEDRDYEQQLKAINDELDENTDKLKENSSSHEQLRFQVGDYRAQLEGLTVQLLEASKQEGGIAKLFSSTKEGLVSATKAGLKFIATPIGAILAAIVVLIAALTTVISNNQSAADEFNKIWGGISSVLDEVFQRVVKLASALLKFVAGDFAGAAKEASAAFTGFSEAMKKAFEEGQKLVVMQIELEKATIKATVATAKLEGQIERLGIKADDATRSFAEREKAANSARQKESELAKINLDLARRELEMINLRVKQAVRRGNINRVLQQEQADALAEFIRAENEALANELENDKIRNELKQDRLEKDLDILIDGFDNIKTINERIISDDNRTVRNRQENLDQLVQLSEDTFAKQIETIKKFTKVSFDENNLLAEQDAVVLNQKIRNLGLSEIIEGRLLEVIRERRTVLADFADLEKSIQEASLARLQEIADNEQNSTDLRIQALFELADMRLAILDKQLADGILNEKEFADQVTKIQEDLAATIFDLQINRFNDEFADQAIDSKTEELNQLIDLNERFRNGEIDSVKEFEEEKLQILADAKRKQLNEELKFLEEKKKLLINAGIDTSKIDKSIAEVRLQLSESTNEELIKDEGKLQDALQSLKVAFFDASLEVLANFNEREDEERQERLERLEEAEERELGLIEEATQKQGESEEAFAERKRIVEEQKQAVIEDFAARKEAVENEQRKADRRRAIFEKVLAATNIGINTAIAIVKAVAASPLTGGLPFSAIAGAIGAVQLADVLTKPIPSFAVGTKNAPKGPAIINELGPELITDKEGNSRMIFTDGPTLTNLKGGERIETFENSKRIISDGLLNSLEVTSEGVAMRQMNNDFKHYFRSLESTIKKQGKTRTDVDVIRELLSEWENRGLIIKEDYS